MENVKFLIHILLQGHFGRVQRFTAVKNCHNHHRSIISYNRSLKLLPLRNFRTGREEEEWEAVKIKHDRKQKNPPAYISNPCIFGKLSKALKKPSQGTKNILVSQSLHSAQSHSLSLFGPQVYLGPIRITKYEIKKYKKKISIEWEEEK